MAGSFVVIEEGAFADFEFEAEADSLEELFAICGKALFSAMTDIDEIWIRHEVEFELHEATIEDLLFSFMAELIYIKDVQKLFLREFSIVIKPEFQLSCRAAGEKIDRERHQLKTDVKAVTYHNLRVQQKNGRYHVRMILDL